MRKSNSFAVQIRYILQNSQKLHLISHHKKDLMKKGVIECYNGELFIRTEGKAAFSGENLRNWRNF